MAWPQEPLTIKGTTSPACFLARLAAFFSFGVSKGRFFASLLVRGDLDMEFAPDHVEGHATSDVSELSAARPQPTN